MIIIKKKINIGVDIPTLELKLYKVLTEDATKDCLLKSIKSYLNALILLKHIKMIILVDQGFKTSGLKRE